MTSSTLGNSSPSRHAGLALVGSRGKNLSNRWTPPTYWWRWTQNDSWRRSVPRSVVVASDGGRHRACVRCSRSHRGIPQSSPAPAVFQEAQLDINEAERRFEHRVGVLIIKGQDEGVFRKGRVFAKGKLSVGEFLGIGSSGAPRSELSSFVVRAKRSLRRCSRRLVPQATWATRPSCASARAKWTDKR